MVSDISRLLRRRVGAGNVLEWCVMTHTCVVSLLTNALFLLLRRREMLHKTKPFRGMNKEMHLKLVCLKGQRPPLERQTVPELAALLRGKPAVNAPVLPGPGALERPVWPLP